MRREGKNTVRGGVNRKWSEGRLPARNSPGTWGHSLREVQSRAVGPVLTPAMERVPKRKGDSR